jgi:hypothetical protein
VDTGASVLLAVHHLDGAVVVIYQHEVGFGHMVGRYTRHFISLPELIYVLLTRTDRNVVIHPMGCALVTQFLCSSRGNHPLALLSQPRETSSLKCVCQVESDVVCAFHYRSAGLPIANMAQLCSCRYQPYILVERLSISLDPQ